MATVLDIVVLEAFINIKLLLLRVGNVIGMYTNIAFLFLDLVAVGWAWPVGDPSLRTCGIVTKAKQIKRS